MKKARSALIAMLPIIVVVALASFPGAVESTDVCGTISTNTTWTTAGSPYNATCNITVSNTLTINAGVTVKFANGTGMNVGTSGILKVLGTSGNPITITSSSASPTAGIWNGIGFNSSNVLNQISYANISYGGTPTFGGAVYIYPLGGTHGRAALDHVTISHSGSNGIFLSSGNTITMDAVTVSDCVHSGLHSTFSGTRNLSNSTISNNGLYGVNISAGTFNITNTTISNNTDYAIGISARAQLGSFTGTVSGNGGGAKDAIGYRGGDSNEVWHNVGLDWIVLANINITGGSFTLTIDPGVIVKFVNGTGLAVTGGTLRAIGTQSSPITFTSASATPTPGIWNGIGFNSTSTSNKISYATITYGGTLTTGGAVYLYYANFKHGYASLDHLTISNSTGYGIFAGSAGTRTFDAVTISNCYGGIGNGSGTNTLSNSTITQNPNGVVVWGGTLTILSTVFVNNSVTGVKITGGTATITNSGFSGNAAGITNTTATIINGKLNYWNSTNGPSGLGFGTGDSVSANVTFEPWLVAIPSTPQYYNSTNVTNRTFNPYVANVSLEFATSLAGSWKVTFSSSSGVAVRTITGSGATGNIIWDGKDDGGAVLQPNDAYTYSLESTTGDNYSASKVQGFALLNTTIGTVMDPWINAASFSPNGDGNGEYVRLSATVNFAGTTWTINVKNSSGAIIRTVTGSSSIVWDWNGKNDAGVLQPEGVYTLEIVASDGTAVTKTVTLDNTFFNFSIAKSVIEFNAGTGQTVTLTSAVPSTLTETLVIKNEAGQILKTLFSGQRTAGNYNDVWNGTTDSGASAPDGAYFFVATLTNGSSNFSYDLSDQQPSQPWQGYYGTFTSYDPFNNVPLTFSYNFTQSGFVRLALSPIYFTTPFSSIGQGCGAPNICVFYKMEEKGPHTISWAGVDNNGAFRPDIRGYHLGGAGKKADNSVVLYGRKPVITGAMVTVSPTLFNPGYGTQNVNFGLSTYQSNPVTVTVTFRNQDSLSVLRTITLNNVSPGNISVPWDGKADNGMWVAPGGYTVTVTVTDSIGNQVSSQILTTVRY